MPDIWERKRGVAVPDPVPVRHDTRILMNASDGDPTVAGQVKWFDPVKGFGFIVADEGGPDILLHANVLRSFGQNSIADGSRVVVDVVPTPRGLQAVAIVALTPPAEQNGRSIAELASGAPGSLASLPFLPARVKWFDKAKGFGFATVFEQDADVFLHVEVLRHGGFADLASGEAVALRVIAGERGLMAAQIASWDRGVTQARERVEGCAPSGPGQPEGVAPLPPDPPASPVGAEAAAQPPLLAAQRS